MSPHPLGLLMPHPPAIVAGIGKHERQVATATIKACESAAEQISAFQPDSLILITPHGPVFKDAVALMATPNLAGDFSRFGAPAVGYSAPVDLALARAVQQEARSAGLPLISLDAAEASQYRIRPELDHGALVPLWFLSRIIETPIPIMHLTYGMLPGPVLFKIGQAIRRASDHIGRRVAFIASGDLSHRLLASGPYGYDPAGPVLDHQIVQALSGNWQDQAEKLAELFRLPHETLDHAAECGLRSLQVLIGFLDGDAIEGTCLSYEGPFGVGYAVCLFRGLPEGTPSRPSLLPLILKERDLVQSDKPHEVHPFVRLARQSLTHYLRTGDRLKKPENLPDELFGPKKACFVSLKKDGELRGCIGTLRPAAGSLAQEIISNAVSAGVHDPRFPPVSEDELDELTVSVDVLSASEPATRPMLDPRVYGVIVRHGSRSGVLLPDLEGVDTVEQQLAIALRKAGIRPEEPYVIERFTVDRYSEAGA